MGFEDFSKKEKKQSGEKWLRVAKNIFGASFEFSVDNSKTPVKFDFNCDKKDVKVGINTETLVTGAFIAGCVFSKTFRESAQRYFEEKERATSGEAK